jgi:hypothetical protein
MLFKSKKIFKLKRTWLLILLLILVTAVFLVYNFIGIDKNAKAGCTSPSQTDCQKCKIERVDGRCGFIFASENSRSYDKWYTTAASCESSAGINYCAQCSVKDESNLKHYTFINKFKQCDCADTDPDTGPGFYANKCEFICSNIVTLSAKCPIE